MEDAKARGVTPDMAVGDSQQTLKEGTAEVWEAKSRVPAWLSSLGFPRQAAGGGASF